MNMFAGDEERGQSQKGCDHGGKKDGAVPRCRKRTGGSWLSRRNLKREKREWGPPATKEQKKASFQIVCGKHQKRRRGHSLACGV